LAAADRGWWWWWGFFLFGLVRSICWFDKRRSKISLAVVYGWSWSIRTCFEWIFKSLRSSSIDNCGWDVECCFCFDRWSPYSVAESASDDVDNWRDR